MIDSVRKTTLSILNKNNFGYISPNDMNNYIKMAQLSIYSNLVNKYNDIVNRQNARLSGEYDANEIQLIQENLSKFRTEVQLTGINNVFDLPTTIKYDYSHEVWVEDSGKYRKVEVIDSSRYRSLVNSDILQPSTIHPIGRLIDNTIEIMPSSITDNVYISYYRTPKDPKWTYTTLSGGEPVFNISASDYQDIELSPQYENKIILEVLKLCGVEIREKDIYQIASAETMMNKQEEAN